MSPPAERLARALRQLADALSDPPALAPAFPDLVAGRLLHMIENAPDVPWDDGDHPAIQEVATLAAILLDVVESGDAVATLSDYGLLDGDGTELDAGAVS